MTRLEDWLSRATRHLSEEAAAQVREEIQQHYESAFEATITADVSADAADLAAVASLGDPKSANRQYRKVLLTDREARMLGHLHWEPRSIPGARVGRWISRICPLFMLIVSAVSFSRGEGDVGRIFLANAIVGFLAEAHRLPIYTPSRGRIFRHAKWALLTAATLIGFGPHLTEWFWLVLGFAAIFASFEIVNHSIRKKLPVARWPKHLYL